MLIMFSSNIYVYVIHLLSLIYGTLCFNEHLKLKIYPTTETNLIDVSFNHTLELKCQLQGFPKGLNFTLNWLLPDYNEKHRENAILTDDKNGSLALTLNELNEKDSGKYICEAKINQSTIRESIIVHVKQKPCTNMFECLSPSNICIHHRYVCDGRRDCDNGLDESPIHCGKDVCKGKIWCNDGRCIPTSWCCHPSEPNCTARVRHSCCKPLQQDDYILYNQSILNNQHYTEMTFLQSTIYTIVGFAMVFMSIVTLLMICICRIHLQRSIVSSVPRRPASAALSRTPHVAPSQRCINERQSGGSSRMFVSYSIPTNDLEIVGDVCQPPPYSEVTCYSDPPPSYKDIFNNRTDEDSETSPCLSSEKPPP